MYQTYYRLKADPFRLSPDPAFCYRHPSFSKGRSYMKYALTVAEGFVVVTGKAGMGKTTLINDLLSDVHSSDYLAATVVTTILDADDLLRSIAYEFGLNAQEFDKATIIKKLKDSFILSHQIGQAPLLIVDEAQNLGMTALEELRLLTNLQMGGKPLLQIFLLGQEKLRTNLLDPRLEQLQQRVTAATQLQPLTEEQTKAYIIHRLRIVGWNNFPRIKGSVLPIVHGACQGVPRRINQFCSRLLLHGAAEERGELTAEDAEIVARELKSEGLTERSPPTTVGSGLEQDGEPDMGAELFTTGQSGPNPTEQRPVVSGINAPSDSSKRDTAPASVSDPAGDDGQREQATEDKTSKCGADSTVIPMHAPSPEATMAPELQPLAEKKTPDLTLAARPDQAPRPATAARNHDTAEVINDSKVLLGKHSHRVMTIVVSLVLTTGVLLFFGQQTNLGSWLSQQAGHLRTQMGFLDEDVPVAPPSDNLVESARPATEPSQAATAATTHPTRVPPHGAHPAEGKEAPRIIPMATATDDKAAQAPRLAETTEHQLLAETAAPTPLTQPNHTQVPAALSEPTARESVPPVNKPLANHPSVDKTLTDSEPSPPPKSRSPEITSGAQKSTPQEKTRLVKEVEFGFDSWEIQPEAKDKLDALAADIKQEDSSVAFLLGHTDKIGPLNYNRQLSMRRAEAVAEYLAELGIPTAHLRITDPDHYATLAGAKLPPPLSQRSVQIVVEKDK
jgi:type II secretory pathway predicted ATPase ExeA/outer membrane protein OmpA-like peptidoglycan-associated protein